MPTSNVLSRTRTTGSVARGPSAAAKTELIPLAVTFYTENKQANEHSRKAGAARKKLLGKMGELADNKPFSFPLRTEEGEITLNVSVDTPAREVIDARALYKAMDCDRDPKALQEFFEMCSITVKAVEDARGKVMSSRVRMTKDGETNVSVKLAE